MRNLINGGGPVPVHNDIIKQIWTVLNTYDIKAVWNWIPRNLNNEADSASKALSMKDLYIRRDVYEIVIASAPDYIRHGGMVYVPDFNRIASAIEYLMNVRAAAVLVLPVWPARTWWVYVVDYGRKVIDLPPAEYTLEPTWSRHPMCVKRPTWSMTAGLFYFRNVLGSKE